jgi:hypothetical protein
MLNTGIVYEYGTISRILTPLSPTSDRSTPVWRPPQ